MRTHMPTLFADQPAMQQYQQLQRQLAQMDHYELWAQHVLATDHRDAQRCQEVLQHIRRLPPEQKTILKKLQHFKDIDIS